VWERVWGLRCKITKGRKKDGAMGGRGSRQRIEVVVGGGIMRTERSGIKYLQTRTFFSVGLGFKKNRGGERDS